jgi:hypothetical protein
MQSRLEILHVEREGMDFFVREAGPFRSKNMARMVLHHPRRTIELRTRVIYFRLITG